MINDKEEISRLRKQIASLNDIIKQKEAESRIPKNLDFVQVQRSELRSISELGAKNNLSLKLLMIFAQTMNKQNAVMISFEALKQMTNKSRATIDRAIKILKDDQWVQVVKVGTANAYVLNSAVFWTDRGDKKYISTFNASVVTTLEEQEKDLRKAPEINLKRVPIVEHDHERVSVNSSEELPPPDQKDLDLN